MNPPPVKVASEAEAHEVGMSESTNMIDASELAERLRALRARFDEFRGRL